MLFLLGRPVQEFSTTPIFTWTLYIRMLVLFGFGIPSLLVAVKIQSGSRNLRPWYLYSYGTGLTIGILYCLTADAAMEQYLVSSELLTSLGLPASIIVCHSIQITGGIALLLIPCGMLLFRQLRERQNSNLILYILGTFLYGVLFSLGSLPPMQPEFLYVGSILPAFFWVWAVFKDIRDMTGKVALLKDELQLLIRTGEKTITPELEKHLDELEKISEGNLEVYKMRVHEILLGLTDATIQAGADTQTLVQRNAERLQQIEASEDPQAVRNLFKEEAEKLSEIISSLPDPKASPAVKLAIEYINKNFSQDLSIDQIAEKQNVSRSHFMRLFKKETGKTVNQFLTTVRIDKAKELLASKTVTDTAFEVGYNDSNYFSTVFKKQTAQSPVQFQKSLNKK